MNLRFANRSKNPQILKNVMESHEYNDTVFMLDFIWKSKKQYPIGIDFDILIETLHFQQFYTIVLVHYCLKFELLEYRENDSLEITVKGLSLIKSTFE